MPRHPFRRPYLSVSIAAFIVGLVVADQSGLLLVRQTDDLKAYHGKGAKLVRVIDGDTIEVNLPDELTPAPGRPVTRVRLWGVDAPEVARPSFGTDAEPLAAEAAEFIRSAAADQQLLLWLESHQGRDSFGAVLAHIELPDGTSLNELILEAGYAKTDDRWPHSRLVRYSQLELLAKERGAGVWAASRR